MTHHPKPYEIAMIQMECAFLAVEKNVQKASALVREAAGHGAQLVCLPEAFNTGYLGSNIPAMAAIAEPLDGYTITAMRQLAGELGIFLLAPIIHQDGDTVKNTAVLIGDDGALVGAYSKTHPVGDEQEYFSRGTEYPVWDTRLGKIGCLICYDACFPETSRLLALKGAQIVLVPAAWRASYYFKEWWDLNLACRALDNLVYVAAVNRTGPSGEEVFAGKSQVCSPIGEVLCTCGVEEEAILYAQIDLERVEKERAFNTVLIDRHPEDYTAISER